MSTLRSCFLKNVDLLHEPIKLESNQWLVLGRGPLTKVSDKRCSRNQVSVNFNYMASEVTVKQTGDNHSGINGLALRKGETHILRHGDRLELLLGQHIYEVQIEELTKPGRSSPASLKRPHSSTLLDSGANKIEGRLAELNRQPRKVALFSKPPTSDVCKWESIDNGNLLIYTSNGVEGRRNIASYDLDHTVITTKTGYVFPKDTSDWKIAYTEVPGKLKQLWKDGFKIVFFTNQNAILKGTLKADDFLKKLDDVIAKLGVPVQAFVSTGVSIYRKPAPGMWNALAENMNDGVEIDMTSSFYCGDAAGRVQGWALNKKKDFSCSDRLFAMNVGLKFYTPEEHFLNARPAKFTSPEFNPSTFDKNSPLCDPADAVIASSTQEMVIMVGYPGSGKSFFAKKHLVSAGYQYVNMDTLGSWNKCVAAVETALKAGKSVVVDNTNPDSASRQRFMEVAKQLKIVCRCFSMVTSKEHSKHNNRFREFTDETHQKITDMIINIYGSKFKEPSLDEGFQEIVKVNFVPNFKDSKLEKLYKLYLV